MNDNGVFGHCLSLVSGRTYGRTARFRCYYKNKQRGCNMSREYVAIWGEARVPIGDNCGATRTPTQEESSQHHAEVISYEMHKRNRHHNKPATRAERRTRREIELEAATLLPQT